MQTSRLMNMAHSFTYPFIHSPMNSLLLSMLSNPKIRWVAADFLWRTSDLARLVHSCTLMYVWMSVHLGWLCSKGHMSTSQRVMCTVCTCRAAKDGAEVYVTWVQVALPGRVPEVQVEQDCQPAEIYHLKRAGEGAAVACAE